MDDIDIVLQAEYQHAEDAIARYQASHGASRAMAISALYKQTPVEYMKKWQEVNPNCKLCQKDGLVI